MSTEYEIKASLLRKRYDVVHPDGGTRRIIEVLPGSPSYNATTGTSPEAKDWLCVGYDDGGEVWFPQDSLVTVTTSEGECTCCEPARPAGWSPTYEDWHHLDDLGEDGGSEASMEHVHEDSTSRDCDGQFDRSSVVLPSQLLNLDSTTVVIGDTEHRVVEVYDFWHKVAMSALSTSPDDGDISITVRKRGECYEMEQQEPTEEGYRFVTLRQCKDEDCAHDRYTQRDHAAERAGY